jgi:hypothetical protein
MPPDEGDGTAKAKGQFLLERLALVLFLFTDLLIILFSSGNWIDFEEGKFLN